MDPLTDDELAGLLDDDGYGGDDLDADELLGDVLDDVHRGDEWDQRTLSPASAAAPAVRRPCEEKPSPSGSRPENGRPTCKPLVSPGGGGLVCVSGIERERAKTARCDRSVVALSSGSTLSFGAPEHGPNGARRCTESPLDTPHG
jgi:hypothetical protein